MNNLTPEEKALGKQNFDEATGAIMLSSRREFLAAVGIVGGTAAAAGLGAKYFKYGPKLDERLRVLGPIKLCLNGAKSGMIFPAACFGSSFWAIGRVL